MGGGSSVPSNASHGRNALTELAGKKFLQCPVVASVNHPTTGDRWALMVFAPMGFFGLVFSARNMVTRQILVKEFTDAELVREKERQGILLSWNVFFKAIGTEIAAAGVVIEPSAWSFTPAGNIAIAARILLLGMGGPKGKPPDVFRCELSPVEATPQNVFRYFLDPLAAFACKRRTDVVDRTDPAKERQYGQAEALAAAKSASSAAAAKVIAEHTTRIATLKLELQRLREEKRRVLGAATAQALLLRGTELPVGGAVELFSVLKTMPERYEDPLLLDQSAAARLDKVRPATPSVFPAAVDAVYAGLYAAESDASSAARGDEQSPAVVAYYVLHRFIPSADPVWLRLHDEALFQLLLSVEQHAPNGHLWFSAARSAFLLRMLVHELSRPSNVDDSEAPCVGLSAAPRLIAALVLALVCIPLRRFRLSEDMCHNECEHFLSSLYPSMPLAHHAVAVLSSLASRQRLCGRDSLINELLPVVVQLVALVDDAEIEVSPIKAKEIFLRCLDAHNAAPADVRTTWIMAHSSFVTDVTSSMSLYSRGSSCSSMTFTHSMSPQFSVSRTDHWDVHGPT